MPLIIAETIVFDLTFLILLFFSIKNLINIFDLSIFIKYIKENGAFLLILFFFAVSLFFTLDIWLMGDGTIYYTFVTMKREWDFGNILDLGLAGHQTCFYTIWLLIGEYIFPQNAVGVRLVIIFLAIVTVCMYYGILRQFYTDVDKCNLALFVGTFAFHPAFWGIIAEINTDFPVLIFFVWVIYFQMKKNYIMTGFSALMLCFSKETGVLILGFYALGCLCVHFFGDLKFGIKRAIRQIFSYDMISIYVAGIAWFFSWLIYSRKNTWTGASDGLTENTKLIGVQLDSFGRNTEYIIHKLKEMFVLNYSYVFWILAIIAVGYICLSKKRINLNTNNKDVIAGIFASFIGFLNFNLYFITWPNYRYLIPFVIFLSLFSSFFVLGYICNKKIQCAVTVFLLILVISSNFRADPISRRVFNTVSLGNGNMISTNLFYINDLNSKTLGENSQISYEYAYDDEGVYNREYSYRSKCINKILKDIKYDSKTLVIFPQITGAKSFYYGRSEYYELEDLYVNTSSYKLSMNYLGYDLSASDKWITFNDEYLNEGEVITDSMVSDYDRVFYVYPLITGKNKVDYKKQICNFSITDDFKVKKCTTGFRVLQIK